MLCTSFSSSRVHCVLISINAAGKIKRKKPFLCEYILHAPSQFSCALSFVHCSHCGKNIWCHFYATHAIGVVAVGNVDFRSSFSSISPMECTLSYNVGHISIGSKKRINSNFFGFFKSVAVECHVGSPVVVCRMLLNTTSTAHCSAQFLWFPLCHLLCV